MIKIGSLFLIFLLSAIQAFAKVDVQAVVSQSTISMEDNLVVTVSVSSDESFDASEPRVPQLDGFRLINSWTSSSTSSKLMQTQGGMQFQTVRRQEFNFQISPDRVGRIQIPGFEVVVDGKPYNTKPFFITVEKAGNGSQANRGQKQRPRAQQLPQIPGMPDLNDIDEADELFNQMLQRRSGVGGNGGSLGGQPRQEAPPANQLNKHNPNEAFYVQLEVDKTSVYEGEQITANWYLYARGNILSLDRAKMPDLKGFWKEVIEEVPALNFTQEVINGVAYRKALLATHALFPIKPGVAVVDEYKIKASVQSPQGPFGLGPAYTYTRSSERVKIDVKPLPLEGRPKDFNGAVGKFDMTASIEGQSFPANQPFTLKVRFDGSGNVKSVDMPSLQLPPGLELYDTKSDSKFFKNGHSYKEFNVLIIPREVGEIVIPTLSVSMFDPSQKKYYTKNSEPIKIKITPAANGPQVNNSLNPMAEKAPEASLKKNELPDIILSSDVATVSSDFKTYGVMLIWIAALLVLLFKMKNELFSSVGRRNIQIEVQKRIKKIEALLEKNEWRVVGTETSNLIYFVLGALSGERGANQKFEKLLDMAPPSVRREVGEALSKQMQLFQTIGFAPPELVGKYRQKDELKKEFEAMSATLKKAIDLAEQN